MKLNKRIQSLQEEVRIERERNEELSAEYHQLEIQADLLQDQVSRRNELLLKSHKDFEREILAHQQKIFQLASGGRFRSDMSTVSSDVDFENTRPVQVCLISQELCLQPIYFLFHIMTSLYTYYEKEKETERNTQYTNEETKIIFYIVSVVLLLYIRLQNNFEQRESNEKFKTV